MAEEFQRNRQYEYRQNSNLVLEAERDSRRRNEASSEVETLNGRLVEVRMGDRLNLDKKNFELGERIEKSRQKRNRTDLDATTPNQKKRGDKNFGSSGTNVLTETEDLDSINYRPKTRDNRMTYEEILSFVQVVLGDQPHDILRGAADEVLSILKDDGVREVLRQKEVEKILGPLSSERFNKLVNLGKRITDFRSKKEEEEETSGKLDEEIGVAVVFDDDEEEEGDDFDEVEENDEDEEGGVEAQGSGTLKGEGSAEEDADDRTQLSVHDIDAHWLQRQLSKFYSDATLSARLSEDTLQALQTRDERDCENKLVALLDFDKFDFIKLLMRNRALISYCTRLKQAQSDSEREAIEAEMRSDSSSNGQALLQQLTQKASAESWAQDRIGEFASKARREARALTKGKNGGIESVDEDDEGQSTLLQAASLSSLTSSAQSLDTKIVDLESLEFSQGGHLMANKSCELPDKSWRAQKKGYEEVHVPAVRPVIPRSERLVEIAELPEWCHPAFEGIRSLNRIQSKLVDMALYGSENILLCAPTGAGKTNVALLCILNQLANHRREDGSFDLDAFKIVYVAPMKALVQECVQSFSKRLAPLGIKVRELSGDQNLSRQQILDTQIIVTTPEKWDIITRKSGDRTYTQLVRLMIIDEIHLLHDERGPVLEALVARTIRQIETTQEMVRLVGLSATLPNFEDVATFLRVKPDKGLFFFDNSYRPVPLQQQYIGITEKKAIKRFQLMNEICYEKVLQQAGRNQVLIFVHSRAETVKTARALRDMMVENDAAHTFIPEDSPSKEILREESTATAKNPDLKDLMPFGFAIHHAGMVRSDRSLVEDLFADKHIQVLVSTATLAWGVNLPCHTVILKGTQMYSPEHGRWVELSPLDIMQMMGRAGRFGLDSEGEGIIMTAHSELQYYLSLMNQQLPIESQMIKRLPDMLNAEIVLGNVLNVREAANWLGYTYLFVRMLRNPSLYGVSPHEMERDPSLMKRRIDIAHTAASILDKHNLIKYDRKSGSFQITILGRVASYYYVSHESMQVFNEHLKPSMTDIEIFRLFSISGEFKNVHVREEEKMELTKLVTRVPIPVKESIEEPCAKVNVLLQAYISRLKLEGFALAADMTYVQQSACRLMRALFEISLKRGWAALSMRLLNICKITERKTWLSQSPLRQFGAIPEAIIRKLEKNSDIPWERYVDLKPGDLGEMVKLPKMGKFLHKYIHLFPKLELSAHFLPITHSLLKIDLTITPDFQFDSSIHDFSQQFWVLVEDVDGENILHQEPFFLRQQYATEDHSLSFVVPLHDPLPPQYFIRVVSDRWLHAEAVLPVSFRHLILPQRYPPPTELLDLQPLPVSALGNKIFSKLFSSFRTFNPIQTQTFTSLYESNDSVLICSPTGSGKTVCAELAMTKQLLDHPVPKIVYICLKDEGLAPKFKRWNEHFGPDSPLGKCVVTLIGDSTHDLRAIEKGDIILSSAANWDTISRRWKQRKAIQNVTLFVFDELHLIGGTLGPTLEIVASRARYVASQLERHVRIVALSSSLANAKDVGEWLGCSPNFIFNFSPDSRPLPLELHLHGFDSANFGNRLLAMAKPAFNTAVLHSPQKPVLVFVPSRKQAQLSAIDFITFASAAGTPDRFLHFSDWNPSPAAISMFPALSDHFSNDSMQTDSSLPPLETILSTIQESVLVQTLRRGVAFIHEGLSQRDRAAAERLYLEGVAQILICPHSLCWSVPGPSQLVIVMDTASYDGKEHSFVDYPVSDLLQMLGQAGRPGTDAGGKGFVLCHSSKREYLKRLLQSPLSVESHLNHFLHDHFAAEVVTKTIENKQDAVDYLTWTFFYRKLTLNPNYYNLQGTTPKHLSDYLSELVEEVCTDLEEGKCISIEEDVDLSALNVGMIASHYYIQYTTVQLFASSIKEKSKVKGLLEILASASEFESLPIRLNEEQQLQSFSLHLPQALPPNSKFEDPATKVNILLQQHFSRQPLSTDLLLDLKSILLQAPKLVQALVDVISSEGWLSPALHAMELSQMLIQGLWEKDSVLSQVPHFSAHLLSLCASQSPRIDSVFDLIEMEDEDRDSLLVARGGLTESQVSDVAVFCNAYPSVEVSYKLLQKQVVAGDSLSLSLTLEGIEGEEEEEGLVVSSRFPHKRSPGWWVVVGDRSNNSLLSIKRVGKNNKMNLTFAAPEDPGEHLLSLLLMSDAYLGCDQEFSLSLSVLPNDEDNEED